MTDIKDKTSTSITVNSQDIEIKRVKMGNLPEVTRAFQPFVKEFENIVNAHNTVSNGDLLGLISSFSDNAVMLAAILTDKPPSFYRELEPLEFLHVMQTLISHSGDFFLTQIFTPLIQIGKQLNTLGTTAYLNSQN
ncbi:hypothetical protein [Psychrobacter pygoscelis]|uniref:hypothetical protein n=1 Tax=Psychrobacter pygoscelis TaxID=2488563 RepID=UPI0010387E9A|nr:hypothetical protein [Psychrobacter pygoscelis]